jgi:uncharacterized protein with NRDE domain
MCLIIFALRCQPGYPLVVAANRDEFHSRPTLPARFYPQSPGLLAGRDQLAGGTWMGVTRGGRFAAVTNFRDPAQSLPAPRSRGELALDFLLGEETAESYLERILAVAGEYAGFNLLAGAGGDLWYCSNSAGDSRPRALAPGFYGLSNARLDTPWPKVELGKSRLRAVLARLPPTHDTLRGVVADRLTADPAELSPLGLEDSMEQVLSAQFIVTPEYGTRSSTTLWLEDRELQSRGLEDGGAADWREETFDADGSSTGAHRERFPIPPVCG